MTAPCLSRKNHVLISKIVSPKITKKTDQNQKLALFATHVLNYIRYTKSFSPSGGGKDEAFAKTGNPNNDKLPRWDASKENDEATFVFDRECECRHNFDQKLVQMGREAFFKYGQFAFGNIQH